MSVPGVSKYHFRLLSACSRARAFSFLTGEATVGSNPMVEQAGGFLKGKLSEALSSKV